uniref:Phosducin domain-containing protein n=1 Tax=Oryza punctata TaxID=4537 RepID=A0A0E0K1S0_ORYPU
MADYHFVYKDVEGASTEWDDIQRRLGNLPPKPEPFKPPAYAPKVDADEQPKSKEWLDAREPDELEDLEDELDDDRFLEQYRRMRLAELREAAKAAKFGSIVPITGSDFVREVSQAPSDVWVVVFLYKDGYSRILLPICYCSCLNDYWVYHPRFAADLIRMCLEL